MEKDLGIRKQCNDLSIKCKNRENEIIPFNLIPTNKNFKLKAHCRSIFINTLRGKNTNKFYTFYDIDVSNKNLFTEGCKHDIFKIIKKERMDIYEFF